jgi:hypothetical protein
VRSVVGETVTAILRSYPGTTYARSSSDLAQPFGLSSQICLCLGVRVLRPGAGLLGGDCFPRLTAMYLTEARPPVVWRPAFEVISKGLFEMNRVRVIRRSQFDASIC